MHAGLACRHGGEQAWRKKKGHFFYHPPPPTLPLPYLQTPPFFSPTHPSSPSLPHTSLVSQDAHTVEVSVPRKPEYSFYAVFDGHGGSYIAMVAAKKLLDCIMDQPAFERVDESTEFLKTAMIEGFKTLDYEMRQVRFV